MCQYCVNIVSKLCQNCPISFSTHPRPDSRNLSMAQQLQYFKYLCIEFHMIRSIGYLSGARLRHFLVFLVLLVLAAGQVSGQRPAGKRPPGKPQGPGARITGNVVAADGSAIPFASIALCRDSVLVTGTASDEEGMFSLRTRPGKFDLKISFLTYRDTVLSGLLVKSGELSLGTITLREGSTTLQEVMVKGERAQMELKLDKRVFNVSKDISNIGANAAEVLDNIPSVTVDVEGNVSLRGSENVRILIDGKPSGLTGISSPDALRQLQGDLVDKVEVITNPSARYEAEGEAGIINIVLKKEKRKGLNGALELRAGYPANYGASLNFNARKEWINFFGNYGIGFRNRPGAGATYMAFDYADTSYSYEQESAHVRGGLSQNVRAGMDIDLGRQSSVTLAGLYSFTDGQNNAEVVYLDFDELNIQSGQVDRTEDEAEDDWRRELSFNYRKTFKQEDRLFTVDAKWMGGGETELADLREVSTDPLFLPVIQQTSSTEDDKRWLFQTDYVHPFSKEGKFEAGGRATLRTLDNDYLLQDYLNDSIWAVNADFDNHLIYEENIYAAYLMAGNKSGNFSYQLGVRAEYSDITTTFLQTNDINHRDYLNFFPSSHFSYEFKQENFIQLSYSRRISRPRHWWLFPFYGLKDSRNLHYGNPNLDPEYTHSFETGYLKQWQNGSLLGSIYYRHTTDLMGRLLVSDSAGITQNFPVNLGVEDNYGLECAGSFEPNRQWSFNGSFNFFRAIENGDYNGVTYTADTYAWTSRVSARWRIRRKFSCQSSFRYRSPRTSNQGRRLSMYNWDVGAALDLFKGNGTLTLSAKDVLNTRKRRHVVIEDNFYSESEFQWRSRQITLSFNYRLNQQNRRKGRGRGQGFGEDFDMEGF